MEPVREDAPLKPRNLYAVGKHASELLARRYGELHGFGTASVRLSYPYGPMERVTGHRARMSLICRWTGNAVRGEHVVVGNRSEAHDYTFVGDVAAGICAVLDAPCLPNDVYNVSAGRPITLEEVIDALTGLRPSLRVVEAPPESLGTPSQLAHQPVRDISRIREDLGFTPRYGIREGLKAYLEWREKFSFMD